jgi:uncharacterized protein YyaL (SSP411 family)
MTPNTSSGGIAGALAGVSRRLAATARRWAGQRCGTTLCPASSGKSTRAKAVFRPVLGRSLAIALLGLAPMLTVAAPLANQLANHPSPYLALHGSDPVAWQTWNADTLARARRENKLLFVSVGYFACHWCHVMQRESYRNPAIAARLNRDFIPVKVDRELNTGLDEALQGFAARLIKTSGWPLNAFVTPQGYPLFVVLYEPPATFSATLQRIADRWQQDAAALARLAERAQQVAPSPDAMQPVTRQAVSALRQAFLARVLAEADLLQGGFGAVSKFPQAPLLLAILRDPVLRADARLSAHVRFTLQQMQQRGLHDALAGGFFRYTTDPGWQTPHFEKMLYDNALLAQVYRQAAQVYAEPAFAATADRTLDFLLTTLRDPAGGFYTSTSAVDDSGREGAYYLWSHKTLAKLLSPADLDIVHRLWGMNRPPEFALGYLPGQWHELPPGDTARLTSIYGLLLQARDKRELPLDRKQNAGLNGLVLSALTAGEAPRYRAAAQALRKVFGIRFVRPDGGLYKTWARGRGVGEGELEDYAYLAAGLQAYGQRYRDERSLRLAKQLLRRALQDFHADSGWLRERQPLLAGQPREALLPDGPQPSASEVWLQTALASGDPGLVSAARRIAAQLPRALRDDPYAYPSRIVSLGGG